jgi:threonine/homoserine/homoserine lactone efflux protein
VDGLIAFLVASVFSFWGSLQLGLVNGAVIQTTLVKGAKPALALAIGGVIPEIPYTLIALFGTEFLETLSIHDEWIGVGVGVIMLLLGIYYYFKTYKVDEDPVKKNLNSRTGSFFKGFALASLNPQLIFFWSGMIALIKTKSLSISPDGSTLVNFEGSSWLDPKICFALGAACGALVILVIYIVLARKYRDKISMEIGTKINKIVGLFFAMVGLYSILKHAL